MALRLAYLTTGYPYVSHTFIADEVRALRDLGVEIDTFAIRQTDPEDVHTDRDREALRTTFALRPVRLVRMLRAHLAAIRRARYLPVLRRALAMWQGSPREGLWQFFYFVQAVLLWHEMDRRSISHVHAHFANVSSDVAMLATALGGEGWSWSLTMHGPTEFADVRHFRLAEKVADARFVACISDFCRSQLMAISDPREWDKLHVVHCGIDTDSFSAGDDPRQDASGPLRVVCVGRLVAVKGQHVLLDAVELLGQRGVPVTLELVGDGPDGPDLRRRVRDGGLDDAVRFAGAVGHDMIGGHLASADVFCLASFAEGVPVVLMEAMGTGLPVVATRIMGIPELVEDDVTGLVVAPGRADLLADALERLGQDAALRARLGASGRERVAQEYELRGSARRLEGLFRASLKSR